MYFSDEKPEPVSAQANLAGARLSTECGRNQNWMADYVEKVNRGGIERVLL